MKGVKFTTEDMIRILRAADGSKSIVEISALCGIVAIADWFVVQLATRGMAQAVSGAVKQGVWVLPTAMAPFSPGLLLAGRRDSSTVNRGS